MGNYYEGRLKFMLKKNISSELIQTLKELSTSENPKISKEFKNQSVFLSKNWKGHQISFTKVYATDDMRLVLCEFDKKAPVNLVDKLYGYYVEIYFCTNDYQRTGELYFDWLQPYHNKQFSDYIGYIEDNDKLYRKWFCASGCNIRLICKNEYEYYKYNDNGSISEVLYDNIEKYEYGSKAEKIEHKKYMETIGWREIDTGINVNIDQQINLIACYEEIK